ncbi:MAG TPA: hypothetical protein VIT65_15890 [Microlunatus sp.]
MAAFIDAALHEPALHRTIVEVVDGDTPVAAAAARVAAATGSRAA